MNRINKFLVAAFMSAAMLLPNMVQAMALQQFDKMATQDRSDYISGLVIGTQRILIDEGRSDLSDQIHTLFTEGPSGDEISLVSYDFTLDRNG
jgi:2-keto-3-deoxy-galactonokinase